MTNYRAFKDNMYEGVATEVFGGVAMRHYKDRPGSLVEMLVSTKDRFPEQEAVVDDENRLTYREFDRLCCNLSGSLLSLGIGKGDRVAILMNNSWEYAVAYYGIIRAGAVAVLLNWRCSDRELEYMLNDSGSLYLLSTNEHWEKIRDIRSNVKTLKGVYITDDQVSKNTKGFKDLLKNASCTACPEINENDPAAIMYTSGTTGLPKGALQTHRNCVANAINLVKLNGFNEHDRFSVVAPMFHASGINATFNCAICAGGCAVIHRTFDPLDSVKKIEQERITQFGGVASMLWMILNMTPWQEYDLSSLKSIVFGGSPCPPELFKQLIKSFPEVTFGNIYGLTEATSTVTFNIHEDVIRLPDSVGQPIPTLDVKIVDPQDCKTMPAKQVGEIQIKGPTVVKEYWRNPEATRETFVDGWLRTGDLGYLDENGYLYVSDRLKDMIVSGGENIYCIEVENAIMQHPAVLEVAVAGVPDEQMQEAVKAAIFLKPGMTATEDDIIEHCKTLIASYKKPKHIVFTSEPLPKNPSGKVLKAEIKEM